MGGGTETTKSEQALPQWYQDAAIAEIQRNSLLQQVGYIPYMGPTQAAFAPQQIAGMQGQSDMAAAFGMPNVGNVEASIPQPRDFGGGIQGYSSFPMYEEARREHAESFPGQADFYSAFFRNPMKTPDWENLAGGQVPPTSSGGFDGPATVTTLGGQVIPNPAIPSPELPPPPIHNPLYDN